LDFFEQQERARRNTRKLLAGFLCAAGFVVACFCAFVAISLLILLGRVPAAAMYWTVAVTGAVISIVSVARYWTLREGGAAVAQLLGARYVDPVRAAPPERRLLNVIEEMAIASGIVVPAVYVLEREEGINALAAGYSPNEAVLVVTRGALERLTRDELQGVMGHEFSHILNGDMALNVRLAALLAGLTAFSDAGESLVHEAARANVGREREARGPGALAALAGALVAFVGFPGAVAADALKAAISREREFLADAASVQFTRNPDGIAGALDSILALRAHTAVRALHASELSHMFFAQAVSRWWSFPTHPPIAKRIWRAHPRFSRSDYREGRRGVHERREVAVLDAQGNVVKTISGATAVAAAGMPGRANLDAAMNLLAALPPAAYQLAHDVQGAVELVLALALTSHAAGREVELAALAERRGEAAADRTRAAHGKLASLSRAFTLPLLELALPVLKSLPQDERDRLIADLAAMIEADRRVTLSQFVLCTFLRQHLREGAGRPLPAHYASIAEVPDEAHAVLSLVAQASGGDAQAAFGAPAAALGIATQPLPRERLTYAGIGEALEKLRLLAPLAKPRLLKACMDCATADGRLRIAEVELVRAIAATLDCPVPALLSALDPTELAP
jgi:Zn-dependent protease with chaperone function